MCPCLKLKLELSKKPCQERLSCKQQKQRLNIFQKRAVRAAVRRTRLSSKVQELKMKRTSKPDESLGEALDVLPPIQQEAFELSFKQAKVKGPQSMRYSTTWVMILLRGNLRSSASLFLALPHSPHEAAAWALKFHQGYP